METEVADRASISPETKFSRVSELENEITRVFHASPERVFRFFTDRATLPYAFARDLSKVTVEEMDIRPGGRYSVVVRFASGSMRFSGDYREIEPPRRIVNTFEVSAWPGVVAIETDTFEPVGEFTRVVVRYRFASREDRDRMRGSGGEGSTEEVWDNIDRMLRETLERESAARNAA